MAALKKTNEAKFKAICTGVREDGAYVEAGENDNLIVQKLAANPGTLGVFGYSFLEENTAKLKGISINGVAPTYQTISSLPISRRPSALHLRQERARPRDPGNSRLRRRIHQGKRDGAEGLSDPARADRRSRTASARAARRRRAALTPLNLASIK